MTRRRADVTVARLWAVLADGRERYGDQLIDDSGMPSSQVYSALNVLMREGRVARRWEDVNPLLIDRARRCYYRAVGVRRAQETTP